MPTLDLTSLKSLKSLGLALFVVGGLAAAALGLGLAARAGSASAGPQQTAPNPQTAPLPQFQPADAGRRFAWVIPLTFTGRRTMVAGTPGLVSGGGPGMRTAPPQLQLELYDRAGAKVQSIYAWHPLRTEYAAVPRPTAVPPRLAATGSQPQQLDPHRYAPYHVIRDQGTGELVVPYDPRASSLRIVDLTQGGVELGRVSLEGAARRYCNQQPTSGFCGGGTGATGGVSRSTLYLDPYTMTVGSNQVFTVALKARRMVDLYGGQVSVTFDPKVLQVVDQDGGRPGAQVLPGDFPKPDSVLRNVGNNSTGRLEYFFTLTGEKPGVSGAGTVAHLVLRGAGPGRTLLTITDTVLSDPLSLAIPTKTENAFITVLDGPSVNLAGQVELERRPTSAGARVCSSGRCVTTAADGRFSLTGVPAGRPVDVTHPSYLRTSRLLPASATGSLTWPKVKVLAGDLDKDDRVDIVDAVMIGQRFNLRYNGTRPDPRWLEACDITDDDVVNILDMTGVQFNMLKTAPGPWPTLLAAQISPAASGPRQQNTRVWLAPAEATVDKLNVDVPLELKVDNVARLYGYRVRLSFDPQLLQVKDVSAADEGVQVAVGEFLDPLNSFVLLNRADNATGVIDISVTQTAPAAGVSGSGVLATLTFRGKAAGSSQVQLAELVLVNDTEPIPGTIPADRAGATVTIEGGIPGIYLPWLYRPR